MTRPSGHLLASACQSGGSPIEFSGLDPFQAWELANVVRANMPTAGWIGGPGTTMGVLNRNPLGRNKGNPANPPIVFLYELKRDLNLYLRDWATNTNPGGLFPGGLFPGGGGSATGAGAAASISSTVAWRETLCSVPRTMR